MNFGSPKCISGYSVNIGLKERGCDEVNSLSCRRKFYFKCDETLSSVIPGRELVEISNVLRDLSLESVAHI